MSEMKYKGPKITKFNQSRRRLLNPKSPLDSQKNKWQTDTTKCSTEYKVSKALITDPDTKHQTYQQSKRTTFKLLDERKFKQRKLKGLKISIRCDT